MTAPPVILRTAKSAGFCFGVRRAIDMALHTAESEDRVYMLGDIVHNEHVVQQIRQTGIQILDHLEDAGPGSLLLRAHGAVPEIFAQAERRGLKIVDATCPLVKEIHDAVRELEQDGYLVIIIGDHAHDEVLGIAGQVKESIVLADAEEADHYRGSLKKIGVVVQSTQNMDTVRAIVDRLLPRCRQLKFINTICKPTIDHQQEIRSMPLENDVMVIVGSFNSANTTRLTQISLALNPRTYQVQSAEELCVNWFADAHSIGVSAGASTPDWILQQVLARLRELCGGRELSTESENRSQTHDSSSQINH